MDKFTGWVKELRKEFPPLFPIRVYKKDLSKEDHIGLCELVHKPDGSPSHFVIRVHKGSYNLMFQILLHEWAHAITWSFSDQISHHGPEWGLALSRLYQHMVEE